jgi:HK97 gp10 family phage protein
MSITIRGLPQLRVKLAQVTAEIELVSPIETKAGGEVVARAMIADAPRDTGRTAASIGTQTTAEGTMVGAFGVPYDHFVQKGTRYMAAQPYGEEAASDVIAEVVTAMASVFKAAIH